jgi:hypothetical protein
MKTNNESKALGLKTCKCGVVLALSYPQSKPDEFALWEPLCGDCKKACEK